MRISVFLIVIAVLILTIVAPASAEEQKFEGTITISGAWAIYPTAVAWAEAFQKIHPKVRVDISAGGAGKGASDAISGLVDIGMVSRDPDPSEIKRGISPVYILHDAVFPVVSANNPALKEISARGISREQWAWIYISGMAKSWDDIAGTEINKPLHVYTRSDSCGAAASWAAFMGKKQEELKGIGVYGDPGLLETVKKDSLGVGYNNFSYIFKRDGETVDGVRIVPIDSNDNGKADPEEIFENRAAAVKALESGDYPARRKNYFFVKGKPKGLVKEFVEFALSDEGSRIVDEVGTSLPIPKDEREKVLKSLE